MSPKEYVFDKIDCILLEFCGVNGTIRQQRIRMRRCTSCVGMTDVLQDLPC
jgi:hypothetical protein